MSEFTGAGSTTGGSTLVPVFELALEGGGARLIGGGVEDTMGRVPGAETVFGESVSGEVGSLGTRSVGLLGSGSFLSGTGGMLSAVVAASSGGD